LRITLNEGKYGLNDNGYNQDPRMIADKVAEFVQKYSSSENQRYQKMIRQIQKYNHKLFADPIPVVVNGQQLYIQPQRTNNIMEQDFRYLKRKLRKKSGNTSVKKTLTSMHPDTALVKNLENPDYMKLLLDNVKCLEKRFAQIDCHLLLKEFDNLKACCKNLPTNVKKMIQEENMPDYLEYIATGALTAVDRGIERRRGAALDAPAHACEVRACIVGR